MSQKRKVKGLSLGQTVERLIYLSSIANNGRLLQVDSEHTRATIVSALYHIDKLRGKLRKLNQKIQRKDVPRVDVRIPTVARGCSNCANAQGSASVCIIPEYAMKGSYICRGSSWRLRK